ncbi:MAG: molybdopterin-dependent oxidoreductase [Halanaerobiales bacterium]|nr:molybdopterin-dependent oxidoreductase [Halanaerobiales bacterium]
MNVKAKGIRVLLLVAVMMLVLSFATYAEENVLITGFNDGDIELSVQDLKELAAVNVDVVSVNSAGHEKKYSVTGPTLHDILTKFGKSQKNLEAIRLIAGDGYSIEVPVEVLKSRQIILAYTINGKPLDEKTKPVRVIIPEERSMYWIRNLVKIEIIKETENVSINEINFLETAIAEVETVDYTYYDSEDKAVQIQTLFTYLALEGDFRSVSLKAVDGLTKNEDKGIFINGYIKITGTDTPLFLSPDLPKGMYVKHLLYFNCGDSAVFSLTKGVEGLNKTIVDEITGISMTTLFDTIGLIKADMYRLTANDGYSVDISYDDMTKGIVYLDDKGRVRSYFSGLDKSTKVKGLLKIEALNQ